MEKKVDGIDTCLICMFLRIHVLCYCYIIGYACYCYIIGYACYCYMYIIGYACYCYIICTLYLYRIMKQWASQSKTF
jgi:uncharacterized membrane protein